MKRSNRIYAVALTILAGSALPLASAIAQSEAGGTPGVITYQGEARNNLGQPLQGAGEVRFELYDQQTPGGVLKGSAGPYAVTFTDGRFTADAVNFAQATAFEPATEQRWLQIAVRAPGTTSFVTLTPRQRLTQTPFAKVATKALGADAAGLTGTLSNTFINNNGLINSATAASPTQNVLGPKNFSNANNVFVGNGAGLTNVNAATYTGGIIDAQLSTNIALLNRNNQVFTGVNTFQAGVTFGQSTVDTNAYLFRLGDKTLTIRRDGGVVPALVLDGAGGNAGILRLRNALEIHPNVPGTDAGRMDLRSAAGAQALLLSGSNGNLEVGMTNLNNGTVDVGSLRFGLSSGEGIASKRTATGNQNGLDFYTNGANRLAITNAGKIGIGTTTPGTGFPVGQDFDRFELTGPDVGLRIKNSNDAGGGAILFNSFGTLHMGIYNPNAVGNFGQVAPLTRRSFFAVSNDGRVGSTTNIGGNPAYRNLLDDGNGNMVVRAPGRLSPGVIPSNHVALFENTDSTNADGIAIKINNADCNKENNFVTFYNASGTVTGRIEGYQLGDWIEPPPALTLNMRPNITPRPLNEWWNPGRQPSQTDPGRLPALGCNNSFTWCFAPGTCATWCTDPTFDRGAPPTYDLGQLPGPNGQLPITIGNPPILINTPTRDQIRALTCWGLESQTSHFAGGMMLAYAIGGVYAAEYLAAIRLAYDACAVDGVTYGSKGADYAEWLERADPSVDIGWGEIVGVKAGKVSRDTAGAEQVLVVSRAPIILGNTPPEGKANDCEKVAFMGQVPVIVQGKVRAGDYIIASGLANGAGIAVSPENLSLDHLSKLVGRAWEDSKSDQLNFVNTAIGINQQAAQHVLAKQQKSIDAQANAMVSAKAENAALKSEVESLKSRLERIESLLNIVPESK